MKIPKEVNSLLMVALVLLAAAIPNQVTLPVEFYKLVEDKTNVVLLMALCVLVSYCNLPLGAMMSIFVMMVMINNPRIEGFEDSPSDCDPASDTYTPNHPECQMGTGSTSDCDPNSTGYTPNHPDCQGNAPVDCELDPEHPDCQSVEPFTNGASNCDPDSNGYTPNHPDCANVSTNGNNTANTTNDTQEAAAYVDYNGIGPIIDSMRTTHRIGDNPDGAQQFCGALNMLADKVQCPISEPFDMLNSLSNSINNLAGGDKKEKYNNVNNNVSNNSNNNSVNDNGELTEGFMGAMSNEPELNNNDSEEFVKQQMNEQTKQVALKQGHDYDVIGCRYDLQGNLNNDFLQGPPVAKCSIYDMAETQNVGCEFYPINP